ncbi:hypothetical protein [Gallaecimonas pentaromativorans]|uniref:hypothetical protein n=1 Tax=Gallaecimonas pentaromativorans TaxID=584787 RepID=UPI003A90635B
MSASPTWTFSPEHLYQINSVATDGAAERCVFGTSSEFSSGIFSFFCVDNCGQALWQQPLAEACTQGFFWAAISNDGAYAAGGGQYSSAQGFLKAYRGDTGEVLLDVDLPARVNQVSLSHDGALLVAVYGGTLQLYALEAGQYQLKSEVALGFNGVSYESNSAVIDQSGSAVVVSCRNYSLNNGAVFVYPVKDSRLALPSCSQFEVGVMRVAIAEGGSHWAALLHDGGVAVFSRTLPGGAFCRYTPDVANLSVGYGLALTVTAAGEVVVACGVNLNNAAPQNQGLLYLLKGDEQRGMELQWQAPLALAANPGVSIDSKGTWVTATDGKPTDESTGAESIGHFYLFDGHSGQQQWRFQTPMMNWPMVISHDGQRLYGGSDDGKLYFWQNS